MRTTVRIDDDLLDRLKIEARKENLSLTRVINRTLKAGLSADTTRRSKRNVYRERVYALGMPHAALDKALGIAGAFDDEEITRKLAMRK